MSIIYKVVRPDMRSAFAPGPFCCDYAIGETTHAPTEVAPLLAFRRLKDARLFVEIEHGLTNLKILRGTTSGRARQVRTMVACEDRRLDLIRRWWDGSPGVGSTSFSLVIVVWPAPTGTIGIPDFTPISLVR